MSPADLPYLIAESLMHEVVHALEDWAGVEFNEERVEALLQRYREKYGMTAATPESQSVLASDTGPGREP